MSLKSQILLLSSEGKNYTEISNLLNCSRSTISYHLNPETKKKTKERHEAFKILNETNKRCKHCNLEYSSYRSVFCSQKCRIESKQRYSCKTCGIKISKTKKYCSDQCKIKNKNISFEAKYLDNTYSYNLEHGKSKTCTACNKEYTFEMYPPESTGYIPNICKICKSKDITNRRRLFKHQCVEYKGGKCSICNYNKSQSALEFHHLNPLEKDFQLSNSHYLSWNKHSGKIKSELDKCILVCSNCHKELHDLLIKEKEHKLE